MPKMEYFRACLESDGCKKSDPILSHHSKIGRASWTEEILEFKGDCLIHLRKENILMRTDWCNKSLLSWRKIKLMHDLWLVNMLRKAMNLEGGSPSPSLKEQSYNIIWTIERCKNFILSHSFSLLLFWMSKLDPHLTANNSDPEKENSLLDNWHFGNEIVIKKRMPLILQRRSRRQVHAVLK